MKRILICILMISVLFCGCGEISEAIDDTVADIPEMENTQGSEQTAEADAPDEVEAETSEEPDTPALTMGQQNALESAKSYLNFMAFSYNGLIEQLEFEEYTTEDAVFAADNCGADWNEQALASAKSYLDTMAFSYEGLREQLIFEEFTEEQATYAADNCGADWNEQAAKSAESYLDMMAFSKDELISQLEYEGFTHDQAVYGVEAAGY